MNAAVAGLTRDARAVTVRLPDRAERVLPAWAPRPRQHARRAPAVVPAVVPVDVEVVRQIPAADTARWMRWGSCVGQPVELFFPESGGAVTSGRGRQLCDGCPVAAQCGEYAVVERIPHGTWGGQSAGTRRAEWLRRAGLSPRSVGLLERVVELTRQGRGAGDVAEVLGVSKRTVVRWRLRAREVGLLPN